MTIAHRFASGGYIARKGGTVEVYVGPGAGGVPMVVVFEGEALAALAAVTAAAFRERSGEWKDVVEAPRVRPAEPRYTTRRTKEQAVEMRRVGRAERDARRWKDGSGE